ncbi:MAG: hypothetical protein ABR571_13520 [Jatrophihabitans sp.]|uniref:hypothetical protein n=1 Tax=Jatrophihabitans sp. TaxID=1932789 RepID=UPI003915FD40
MRSLFLPRNQMAEWLRYFSDAMQLSYAVEALQHVTVSSELSASYVRGAVVLAGSALLSLALAAATLRRQTA